MSKILEANWASQAVVGIASKMTPEKRLRWETQAGKMFFKHQRAGYDLRSVRECYSRIIEEKTIESTTWHLEEGVCSSYTGPMADALFFHIDSFFEAERSAHDFVLACLRSADVLRLTPSSFHDFYKKLSKTPDTYPADPPEIRAKLKAAWEKTGQRTKAYRDCFSHYVSLSGPTWQTAVNMRWTDGSWKATFHLPDNPEGQSYDKFKFDGKRDAVDVCRAIYEETGQLLESVISACLLKWKAEVVDDQATHFTIRNVRIFD